MTIQAEQFLKSALALSATDRAEIAASLIRSLDPQVEENLESAWANEIKGRIQDIDDGQVALTPLEDVLAEMRRNEHGQAAD